MRHIVNLFYKNTLRLSINLLARKASYNMGFALIRTQIISERIQEIFETY